MQMQALNRKLMRNHQALLHSMAIVAVFGAVVGLIFLTHPDCVYGSKTDWSNQHFAIPEYFRTRFYATGNFFPQLAMQLGGGQNIFNFAYYGLYSPVILLSFALPWVRMATYLQVSHLLLTILSALLCYFWLRKWFSPNGAFLSAMLFLLAAPVIFHSHHHIMFVNYFPFLFWALFSVHRVLEKRFSLSLILAAVCILLTDFYFGVGAFVCIFLYAVFVTLDKHAGPLRRPLFRNGLQICLHLLLGTVLAAFLLLPVLWTLLHGRDSSGSTQSLWSVLMPGVHLSYLTYSPYSMGMPSCSVLAVCAMLIQPKRSCRFLAGTFAILLLFPILLYLMNGTMYLDAKAYIPLLPLLVLLCGFFFRDLQKVACKPTLQLFSMALGVGFLTEVKSETKTERIALILDGAIMLLSFFLFSRQTKQTEKPRRKPRFHPTKWILVPTVLCGVLTCLAVNLGDSYVSKSDVTAIYSTETQTLVDRIAASDSTFYRTAHEYHAGDTVNRVWSENDYRTTVYSSVHNTAYSNFCFRQTCNENSIRNAAMLVQSKNPIFNILMGEKYLISQEKITRYGFRQIAAEGKYRLYENTLAYPIGYAISGILSQERFDKYAYPTRLEALLKNAVVTTADLQKSGTKENADCSDSVRKFTSGYQLTEYTPKQLTPIGGGKYYVHSEKAFIMKISLNESVSDLLLLQFHVNNRLGNGTITGDVSITVNGIRNKLTDPSWKYQNQNDPFQYTISSETPIRTLTLTCFAGDYVISDIAMYTMDYRVLSEEKDSLDPWELDRKDLGDDTLSGDISVKKDGWFLLSVPYDSGFHITVDGKSTDYYRTDTDFIGFPITVGKHRITVTYAAPLAKVGRAVSVMGIGIAAAWGICHRIQSRH